MENDNERYNKLRRQKINLMLNDEERRIITEKAIKYGYGDCLAEYIRAASIYENIYIEDVQGKLEVCDAVSKFIEILNKILNEQKVILKSVILSSEDIEKISEQNLEIHDMIEALSKLIVSSLSVNTEKRKQKRMNMIDKVSPSVKLLEYFQKKTNLITCFKPSNLNVLPNDYNDVVYLEKYSFTFDKNNVDVEEFDIILNCFRKIAMLKENIICINVANDKLYCGVARTFDDAKEAEQFAIQENQGVIWSIKDSKLVGDSYSNHS